MATLAITKDKGGVGRPEGMTVISAAQVVPLAQLKAIGKQAKLDGVVVADLLSAMAMHEREAAGAALAAASQTERTSRRKTYETVAELHTERVQVFEALLVKLQLPALYVSPASRAAHFLDMGLIQGPLLAGSVDARGRERMLLDVAWLLAEQSLANTEALAGVATAAATSPTRTALVKAVKLLRTKAATLKKLRALRRTSLVAGTKRTKP
ncbi:hypothetical protein [Nannocystis punicea]|uniref:Uncharacterized protein n=1 Tax=Nannocystis punicea TaxID=2995304 RepID=A0ABY7GUV2_9BACT|nr:hypothetical protein [Nannocystis poenicansa]WAS90722.1 hypothetical protein O0S08_31430 [Nannocystis poenicansa]